MVRSGWWRGRVAPRRRTRADGRTISSRSSGRRYGCMDGWSVDRTALFHHPPRFRGLAIETVLKRRVSRWSKGRECGMCVRVCMRDVTCEVAGRPSGWSLVQYTRNVAKDLNASINIYCNADLFRYTYYIDRLWYRSCKTNFVLSSYIILNVKEDWLVNRVFIYKYSG